MSAQTWALIGVVVGAVLGGLSQVVADQLRARREREVIIGALRRDAYIGFISSVWTIYNYSMRFMMTVQSKIETQGVIKGESREELETRVGNTNLPEVTEYAKELDHALSKVALCGPHEIAAEARRIERFVWENFAKLGSMNTELQELVDHFTTAAQKHSGLA
jgi:hypothetical protein